MRTSTIWWVVGVIVVILIIWAIWAAFNPSASAPNTTGTATSTDEAAAIATVTGFGTQLQDVSLLAPDASTTIAQDYTGYVDPTLLATWEQDPASAPGRQTSSPWPDHIDVSSATQNAVGYDVQGTIALMTSTGPAGTTPFGAMVEQENGAWYITSFIEGSSTTAQ